jgi:hypothetical protein
VEGQLRLSGDSPDCDQTGRRGSTSARRSFFKRIKPQRSSSRDSKELASFSNTHLSLYLDPNSITEEIGVVPSYQRVERLECKAARRVQRIECGFSRFPSISRQKPAGVSAGPAGRMCGRQADHRLPEAIPALHAHPDAVHQRGDGAGTAEQFNHRLSTAWQCFRMDYDPVDQGDQGECELDGSGKASY